MGLRYGKQSRAGYVWLAAAILLVASGFLAFRFIQMAPKQKPGVTEDVRQQTLNNINKNLTGRYLLNGTVTWARAVEQQARGDYNQPFSMLNSFNRDQYDAWSADFECPITNNTVPYQTQIKQLIFNCRPEFLPAATQYFNIFDLSNNHTGDQGGEKGLQQTRQHLEAAGAQYFGTFDPADSQNVCEVIALPVRVVSGNAQKGSDSSAGQGAPEQRTDPYKQYGDGAAQVATPTSAESTNGAVRSFLPVAMCGWQYFGRKPLPGELEAMDAYTKIMPVFAFVEMGTEYLPKATEDQINIAHQIIAQGPEFLVANNPHWVQNTEIYKGKLIVYSLGNFIFDQLDSETNRSASIDVTMTAPYDDNLAKWIALAPNCRAFHDDCLAKAQAQGLSKVKISLKYAVVAGQNGYKEITRKADVGTQKAVEDRLNWQQTLMQLGQ